MPPKLCEVNGCIAYAAEGARWYAVHRWRDKAAAVLDVGLSLNATIERDGDGLPVRLRIRRREG